MGDLHMTGIQLLGITVLIVIIALAICAIWLTCILLGEAQDLKKAVKDVQCAYGNIEIELNKKLKVNNALHYSDLVKIVRIVGNMVPGVEIVIDKEFENDRLHILIEAGGIKSRLTLIATIVEYGIPRFHGQV